MRGSTPKPPLVVLVYAQADLEHAKRLKLCLRPAERASHLRFWDRSEITPGDERERTLADKLQQAEIIVFLLSRDLLADDSACQQAKRALERQRNGSCRLFPVKLHSCLLSHTPFESLQLLPRNALPVTDAPSQEAAWVDIAQELLAAGEQVRGARDRSATPAPEGAPRVLVAGPFFGLLPEERAGLAQAWETAPDRGDVAPVRRHLDSRDTSAAYMAALLRFDTILDLSPWAAFARWSSTGCMVVSHQRELPVEADGPVVLTVLDPGQPLQRRAPGMTREIKPWLTSVHGGAPPSLALAGFDAITAEWAAELVALLGSVAAVEVLPEEERLLADALARRDLQVEIKAVADRFDAPSATAGLDDYRRALRIVAGQVLLPGDVTPRSTTDVFVDMDIHRLALLFPSEPRGSKPRESELQERQQELREELHQREERKWPVPSSQIIQATSLVNIAPRVLLWGKAGTGKSTLLRQLAASGLSNRFPVWLQRIPQRNEGESFPELVARQALEEVHLASAVRLRRLLRTKIESGEATLLLDGLDEVAPEVRASLPEWLRALHPDTRVLLASRPSGAPTVGLEEVELVGLSVSGPEQMLHAYFGESAWIPELLQALHTLPDGPTWLQTPVLLALAARIYEKRGDLPRATMDLLGGAMDHMLDRAGRRWSLSKDVMRRDLAAFAARLLVPSEGSPRVAFPADEIPGDDHHREALRSSGIFAGRDRLRFAHLSFGEYLAALGDIDLSLQRARLCREVALDGRSTLEVLPMAHAHGGLPALEALWREAVDGDAPDHRLLGLLLRALAYGGEGAEGFARQHGRQVIVEITKRLQPASGRFGAAERALLDDLERAQALLAPHVRRHAAKEIVPLRDSRGDVRVEAISLLHDIGEIPRPERALGRTWPVVWRQARALVRQGAQVHDVIALTLGERWETRSHAVYILGKHPAHWPVLRPLLEDPEDFVRVSAVAVLAEDESVLPRIRERLTDDASRVRGAAVIALGRADRIALHAPALARLLHDSDMGVVHAAIDALSWHVDSRSLLRSYGWESLNSSRFFEIGDVIEPLADDADADALITAYLDRIDSWYMSRQTLTALAAVPRWRSVLIDMLRAGRAVETLVPVLAASPNPSAREAAARFLDHPDPWVRLDAALANPDAPRAAAVIKQAFGDTDALFHRYQNITESTLARIVTSKLLAEDEGIFSAVHEHLIHEDAPEKSTAIRLLARLDVSKARPILWRWFDDAAASADLGIQTQRSQVPEALGGDIASKGRILAALEDRSEYVRRAVVELLKEDQDARKILRRRLEDDDGEVWFAALDVFSHEPQIQNFLLTLLSHDNEPLRTAAFMTLAAQREHRQRLVEVFRTGPEQVKLSAVVPLCMSRETRPEVYPCMDDLESSAAKRVASLLSGDEEVRSRVHRALHEPLPKREVFWGIGWLFDLVAGDPGLEDVFSEHTKAEWGPLAQAAVTALAKYPSRRPQLFELAKHGNQAAAAAAIRALANEPEMAATALAELERDDLPGEVLAAWVDVVGRRKEPSERIRTLIAHTEKGVRLEAARATVGDPASFPALRAQLEKEHDESVKQALLDALARDPDALPVFRTMLRDPSSAVRRRATELLRRAPLPAAHAADAIPSVSKTMRLADGSRLMASSRSEDALLHRVGSHVEHPAPLHLEDEPELSELLLGWLAARLGWASPDGEFRGGHMLGETEQPIERLLNGPDIVLIRVAMDSSDVSRERLLHPNHNLIEAWRVAQHLTSDYAPALVLACADVAFEHLSPPHISPGQAIWGPTFYGFRLARMRATPFSVAKDSPERAGSGEPRRAREAPGRQG